MALPQLNATPKYSMTVPSLGKEVRYRPYLVKEEKILMMASEAGDQKQLFLAVLETTMACLEQGHGINPNDLTTFDIEYMFTKIRSKSVGEVAKIRVKCVECKTFNDMEVDLEDLRLDIPKAPIIEMSPEISLKMRYPSYKSIMAKDLYEGGDKLKLGFEVIAESIESILLPEEQLLLKDHTEEEIQAFIGGLSGEQFAKISSWVSEIPRVNKDIEFDCLSCEHHNSLKLEGMSDFF